MRRKFKVVVNGKEYTVEIEELGEGGQAYSAPAGITPAAPAAPAPAVPAPETKKEVPVVEAGEGAVTAPMPGKILDIKVKVGDSVKSGDVLVILEAMKMENEIVAPKDGTVKDVQVNVGDNVDRGAVLVVIG
ncbi:acetyl-CoA carboxylase biotin carboxyl carrier protein subunit [Euryarchaeota archaeon ex4484_178]|nr:MAG: acetyl-CoA carboxylase biotin carboxyl carrier protein subunit [Euryarchaeota archaeon ex4484_178]